MFQERKMLSRKELSDIVVIGGGLAGVSAAVSAARLGSKVSLVTNRPVLGGNSSSEIRVWVVGATAHGRQRFARETGIMGELFLENQYRNADGNPYYWDQTVLDLVRAEPNITLHLNTDVRAITLAEGEPIINSATGWTMGSEIETEFIAPMFVDCTGDGLVGYLAGAEFRVGRESRELYGETLAPEVADKELLGSSLFFYSKDAGHPVPFIAPLNAKNISATSIPSNRIMRTGDNGCDYWWIEWGGHIDTVSDNETIRDELWSIVFGIWDFIKNSGNFNAENLTLEWVGSIPGKREYRRFIGDYTLTEGDILGQRKFDDAVAFGGWSIDLHPVEGVYAQEPGAKQLYSNGTYGIPFRSLYSRNVSNLLFAGRNISASHVAFGSTRVMATCSTLGQAAGTAAHLASKFNLSPRDLSSKQLPLLQQTLLREDAPVFDVFVTDPDDLALSATVSASSTLRKLTTAPHVCASRAFPLVRDVALIVPVDPTIDQVEFIADAARDSSVTIELWDTGKPQNYVPVNFLMRQEIPVSAGKGVSIAADFSWRPESPCNAVIVVRSNPEVSLLLTEGHPYGVMALTAKHAYDEVFDSQIPDEAGQLIIEWGAKDLRRRSFVATVEPETNAYVPARLTDGIQRPYGGPQLWSSEYLEEDRDLSKEPEFIELAWDSRQDISSIRVVFNDDVDEDLINLHHHRTPFPVIPELVADYKIEVLTDLRSESERWLEIVSVARNRHRHRIHDVPRVQATRLRLVVTATNGSRYVSISALKVYSEPSARTSLAHQSFTASNN